MKRFCQLVFVIFLVFRVAESSELTLRAVYLEKEEEKSTSDRWSKPSAVTLEEAVRWLDQKEVKRVDFPLLKLKEGEAGGFDGGGTTQISESINHPEKMTAEHWSGNTIKGKWTRNEKNGKILLEFECHRAVFLGRQEIPVTITPDGKNYAEVNCGNVVIEPFKGGSKMDVKPGQWYLCGGLSTAELQSTKQKSGKQALLIRLD